MGASPDVIRPALAEGWQVLARNPAAAQAIAEALLAEAPVNPAATPLRGATPLPAATLLLAAALRRQNRIGAAHARLAPLMAQPPEAAIPWFEWGMLLASRGEDLPAIAALQRATAIEPGLTAAWRGLGDVALTLGDGPRAGNAYAQAARAAASGPRLAQAGAALCANRLPQAEAMLRAHLNQNPTDLRALLLLAETLTRLGGLAQAETLLTHCLTASPGFADARHSLAVLLYTQRKFGQAAPHFAHLLALAPYHPSLRRLLAICLAETGDYDAALPQYEALLQAAPHHPATMLQDAHALKTMGRDADAAAAYRACIALAPHWAAGAYLSLADIKTAPFTGADIAAMQALLNAPAIPPADAAQLHYALGRAQETRGAYDDAFAHFAAGARHRRAAIAYDPDSITAFVESARSVFTPDFFDARKHAGCVSKQPIFIVGMPRAGSTLVEQILASHSQVEGSGELTAIGDIAAALRAGRPLAALPGIIAGLSPDALTALGETYLTQTAQYRRLGRAHVIDKMPDNALHAGLIHLILPQARIIDIRRAPMAAGMAAFKQYFQPRQTGQDYSYDLTEIGRYTRDYIALIAHVAAILPGRIHTLPYESLVTDTEAEIRRLLAQCGLAFEPACLRFWETARPVQTPSAQQVRQPIFTTGLAQWRHYAPHLAPLRQALGDLAPPWASTP
jgi:tetratricopeptide (TPR) repeat protein